MGRIVPSELFLPYLQDEDRLCSPLRRRRVLASAGVVITPILQDQVVPKVADDCFFGVTTPQGCATLRNSRVVPAPRKQ
ncbi:uncharacterized protein PG986_003006 [Apiospora aurea]|uniref:Uncharacterized protein n=1 Tax=Apiospora aurea TaxID=335848 RepID=A0ABR1QQF4_9PEZI